MHAQTLNFTTSDYTLVARAIGFLEEHQTEQPTLEELASELGVSPFHLQRVFSRWAGISPKRFLQYLTVEHAKALLASSHTVLDAAYASGLSGPGRLHDLFVTTEAMTPGEYKEGGRGLTIAYGLHRTPFGEALLALITRGVCGLSFVDSANPSAAIDALHARWPNTHLLQDKGSTAQVIEQIFPTEEQADSRSNIGLSSGPLRLLLSGTNFQIRVWEALLRIPFGGVRTYEEVAVSVGAPSASRAVGGAVGANHIAYLIPCHRVIRKSGVVEGSRWGSTRKKALLAWESAHAAAD